MQTKKLLLVTGGGGYLGSVMVPILLKNGYQVRVLDRFFWGKEVFSSVSINPNLELIEADTRNYPADYLKDVDTVIDLAALSNDPIGELDPKHTLEINFNAREHTANLAKAMGVKRYILASSCSVYGFQDGILDERSPLAPVTTYARASLLAEQAVLPLADNNFCVTALRQGTLYGLSPRMRFDVVLNTMTLSMFKNGQISVQGGEQWRPILHVTDSARAFIAVLEAEPTLVNGEIFNIGGEDQNYQISELARIIATVLGSPDKVMIQDAQTDFRSYRVSMAKINRILGYNPNVTPGEAAKEIFLALEEGKLQYTLQTKTVEWYKHLLEENPKILEVAENKEIVRSGH